MKPLVQLHPVAQVQMIESGRRWNFRGATFFAA
jgi:hypothetical protein